MQKRLFLWIKSLLQTNNDNINDFVTDFEYLTVYVTNKEENGVKDKKNTLNLYRYRIRRFLQYEPIFII
jgi:hypothetical protein